MNRTMLALGMLHFQVILSVWILKISGNEAAWRKWYDENEPESVPVPDYDERINMDRTLVQPCCKQKLPAT